MGSFLNSCSITNISIQEDSLTYITPVMKNVGYYTCKFKETKEVAYQEYKSPCYSNALWKPIGLGIVAKAQDCGRNTPLDDEMNRISLIIFFRELYKNSLTTLEDEGNSYHGCSFDFKSIWEKSSLSKIEDFPNKMFTISFDEYLQLWKYIEEGESKNRIFSKDYSGKIVPVKFSICIYEVFHELATKFPLEYVDNRVKDFKERDKHLLKNSKASKKELMAYLMTTRIWDIARPPSGREVSCAYTPYIVKEHKDLDTTSNKSIKNFKNDLIEIHLFWSFQEAMNNLGMVFSINKYAGQDYSNEIGKDYLRFIEKMNKEYNQWIEESQEDW